MVRFVISTCLLLVSFLSFPQTAQAANFGFVRWPDYLDIPIFLAVLVAVLSFVMLKTLLPKGADGFISVPKEERSALLTMSAFLTLASVVIFLGLVFVGMGLQRIAE